MAHSFRHSAGFGKRMEYWIIGRMLKEGLDVYVYEDEWKHYEIEKLKLDF